MEILLTLAVFYHVAALASSVIGVFQSLCRLQGLVAPSALIQPLIRIGEIHLWISGTLIIALGCAIKGWTYLDNPKLWTKVILVVVWSLNSLWIRTAARQVDSSTRSIAFGVSLGSLIYGTFLGVAKPLAYGVAPFWSLLAGYLGCLALSGLCMHHLMEKRPASDAVLACPGCGRGLGSIAASPARQTGGSKTRCVVPSRSGIYRA